MKRVMLPDGIYFVGDPMYVLDKDKWHDKVYLTESIYEPELRFWHHKTEWGDGVYYDQNDNRYPVDSASIGVVPIEIWRDTSENITPERLGVVRVFPTEFICEYDNGVFKIGVVEIDTG